MVLRTVSIAFILACAPALALKGRVVDAARKLPVPGAVVTHADGTAKTVTDAEGRFELFASSVRERGVFPGIAVREGRLHLSFAEPTRADIALFTTAGRQAGHGGPRDFARGEHVLDAARLFAGVSSSTLGLLRVRAGGRQDVFKVTRFLRGGREELALGAALSKPAAGQITVAKELLKEASVPFITEGDDLGDIVLAYPERKTGVGAAPVYGAQVLFDGTAKSLEDNWEMWQSAWRIAQKLAATPVNWELMNDPVDATKKVMAAKVLHSTKWYARHDIVTRKKYRDFQVHVEFNVAPGANSGVYLQNRYEMQVFDGGGVGDLYAEAKRTSNQYAGANKWNAYDITFRAARWNGTTRTKKATMSMWWNGVKVHDNVEGDKTQGMDFNGEEGQGFVPGGELVDPSDQGLKFQNHGSVVRYRNIWILELDIAAENTAFGY